MHLRMLQTSHVGRCLVNFRHLKCLALQNFRRHRTYTTRTLLTTFPARPSASSLRSLATEPARIGRPHTLTWLLLLRLSSIFLIRRRRQSASLVESHRSEKPLCASPRRSTDDAQPSQDKSYTNRCVSADLIVDKVYSHTRKSRQSKLNNNEEYTQRALPLSSSTGASLSRATCQYHNYDTERIKRVRCERAECVDWVIGQEQSREQTTRTAGGGCDVHGGFGDKIVEMQEVSRS